MPSLVRLALLRSPSASVPAVYYRDIGAPAAATVSDISTAAIASNVIWTYEKVRVGVKVEFVVPCLRSTKPGSCGLEAASRDGHRTRTS